MPGERPGVDLISDGCGDRCREDSGSKKPRALAKQPAPFLRQDIAAGDALY